MVIFTWCEKYGVGSRECLQQVMNACVTYGREQLGYPMLFNLSGGTMSDHANIICQGADFNGWKEAYEYFVGQEPNGEFVGTPTYPSSAKAGDTIKVNYTIRNSGGGGGNFEVRPKDQKGVVYPGSGFVWLDGGVQKAGEVNFYMPNYSIIKGTLRLIRRT